MGYETASCTIKLLHPSAVCLQSVVMMTELGNINTFSWCLRYHQILECFFFFFTMLLSSCLSSWSLFLHESWWESATRHMRSTNSQHLESFFKHRWAVWKWFNPCKKGLLMVSCACLWSYREGNVGFHSFRGSWQFITTATMKWKKKKHL